MVQIQVINKILRSKSLDIVLDNDITEEKSNVKEEPKKGFFGGFFSKLFSKNKNDNKDNIIRKKNYQYEYKPKKNCSILVILVSCQNIQRKE